MRVWKRIKINSSIEPCCMLVKHLTVVGKKAPAECSQRGREGKMKCSEMVQSGNRICMHGHSPVDHTLYSSENIDTSTAP